jgi:hypothetical protein
MEKKPDGKNINIGGILSLFLVAVSLMIAWSVLKDWPHPRDDGPTVWLEALLGLGFAIFGVLLAIFVKPSR